jgi:hypothetical protein
MSMSISSDWRVAAESRSSYVELSSYIKKKLPLYSLNVHNISLFLGRTNKEKLPPAPLSELSSYYTILTKSALQVWLSSCK